MYEKEIVVNRFKNTFALKKERKTSIIEFFKGETIVSYDISVDSVILARHNTRWPLFFFYVPISSLALPKNLSTL